MIALIDLITLIGGSSVNLILVPLGNLRDSVHLPKEKLMREYDQLCTTIATNKAELRASVEAACIPARIDTFWYFFLEGVAENQLARPEEYNYQKNLVHNPVWIALFCTKLNVPPPPVGVSCI